jgi:hypothetical protein
MLQALPVIHAPKIVPPSGTEPVDIWAGYDHPISVYIITSYLEKGIVFHLLRDFPNGRYINSALSLYDEPGRKTLGRLTAVRPATAVGFYCLDHTRDGEGPGHFGSTGIKIMTEIMTASGMEHLIFEKLNDWRFNLIIPE